jgi:hypothetical protein
MQTFLPYPNFNKTAKCLDCKRLGKQRVEAYQILLTLENDSRWRNHPAVKMWKGYETALATYGLAICDEWIARGYVDNLRKFFLVRSKNTYQLPKFIGLKKFHDSHKSNLLRKKPEYYSTFWNITDTLEYYWPTNR